MRKKPVPCVRRRDAHQFLKICPAIIRDGEALLDVEAVFFGRIFPRVAALPVEPSLNAAPHVDQREFRELFFKSGVVGEEDLTLPFPDTLLRRRDS
jgi:hypothetical protein